MIDLLIAIGIGMVFGFLLKREKQPPVVEILQTQVDILQNDIQYYKKLTKGLVEENTSMRKKLRKNNE